MALQVLLACCISVELMLYTTKHFGLLFSARPCAMAFVYVLVIDY